ncbi:unnamed protein product [Effrenium voratum]|nr:unnamed protein product [Effrenium voratum]
MSHDGHVSAMPRMELQPWTFDCSTLEGIHYALNGAQGWSKSVEIFIDVIRQHNAWDDLLHTGQPMQAGWIAQHAIAGLLTDATGMDSTKHQADKTISMYFETSAKICGNNPTMALAVLGGGLTAFQSVESRAGIARAVDVLKEWFVGNALEQVVRALIEGNVSNEFAHASIGWLCGIADRFAACKKHTISSVQHFANWLDSQYLDRLVAAFVAQICRPLQKVDGTINFSHTTLDLMARMVLRGNASVLAAKICDEGLASNTVAATVGQLIERLSYDHVSASRSLMCTVLEAATMFLWSDSSQLFAYTHNGVTLLQSLLQPSLGAGLPIQQHLAVHIWRIRLGSQLPAPVVFALVDILMAGNCSQQICSQWLQIWSQPPSHDTWADRNLALRIARALQCTSCNENFGSQSLHLLLEGIHLRLSMQAKENRLHGMAIAEFLAGRWESNTVKGEEQLRFDNFDRDDASVVAFKLVAADFQVATHLPVKIGDFFPAARNLCDLLTAREGARSLSVDNMDIAAPAKTEKVHTPQETDSMEAPNGMSVLQASDSDDEEEDHPLRGLAPLSPFHVAPDKCSDLLLVQPPAFLRSAFEMLLGPSKAALTRLSDEAPKPGSAPEPPATTRARLSTALAELPGLVAQGPEELSRLAGPICDRVCRLEVDSLADLKVEVLISLLVEDGSRRPSVQHLVTEFGNEDISLAARRMVLKAMAAAARKLSDSKEDNAAHSVGPALGVFGKTRRFASATRIPTSAANRFASQAMHFIRPLMVRWKCPHRAASWAMGEPSLVGEFLHCLGVMLECAGTACPDKDILASECAEPAVEVLSHNEPLVRRCSLFLLSRIVLVGCEEVLLDRLDGKRLPSVQDLDVTVLAFAQWLSEMKLRSNSSLQQMLAEMGIIRNGITSNNTDLTEFKRNTATVQQQMQSQISDLRDKLTDAYTEIANMKKTKSQFEQEVHAECQSLSEQLQFKTLELETLKKAYAHTHQQLQQQIIQLQTEVNELRMRGDDANRQQHLSFEQNVNKVSEVAHFEHMSLKE